MAFASACAEAQTEQKEAKDVGLQYDFLAETRLIAGTLSGFTRSLINQLANLQKDQVETELLLFQLSQTQNQ